MDAEKTQKMNPQNFDLLIYESRLYLFPIFTTN